MKFPLIATAVSALSVLSLVAASPAPTPAPDARMVHQRRQDGGLGQGCIATVTVTNTINDVSPGSPEPSPVYPVVRRDTENPLVRREDCIETITETVDVYAYQTARA